MNPHRLRIEIVLCAWVGVLAFHPQASLSAQGVITTIAFEGQSAPDGNGVYNAPITSPFSISPAFGYPVINESGQVAFTARLGETSGGMSDALGVFLHEGAEVLQLARSGSSAPGTNGNFSSFGYTSTSSDRYMTLNASGETTMLVDIIGDPNYNTVCGGGIFRFHKDAVDFLAACGSMDPRGIGVYSDFFPHGMDSLGRIAFSSRVKIDDNNVQGGIFFRDESGTNTIVHVNDPVPGKEATTFTDVRLMGMNNKGTLLMLADDTGHDGGITDESVYLGSKEGLTRLMDKGDPALDGNGTVDSFAFPQINDNNQVVVVASMENTSGNFSDRAALLLWDDGVTYQLGRAGSPPLGGDNWTQFQPPTINEAGVVAFHGIAGRSSGIFIATTEGVTQLVATGAQVPGVEGTLDLRYTGFPFVDINNAGQVLFKAQIKQPNGFGVFLADPDGTLHTVVVKGRELEGDAINDIELTTAGGSNRAIPRIGNQRSLNDAGQVTFWAELNNGKDGIFLWSPPPPEPEPPAITDVSVDGTSVVVILPSYTGLNYQLRRLESFQTGVWLPEGDPLTGTGTDLNLRHEGALEIGDRLFYDVRVTGGD